MFPYWLILPLSSGISVSPGIMERIYLDDIAVQNGAGDRTADGMDHCLIGNALTVYLADVRDLAAVEQHLVM